MFVAAWLVAGCKREAPPEDPPADTPDGEIPARDGSCPDEAPVVGETGGLGRWSGDVTWTWSQAARMSVGAPLRVRMADDVTGLTVSVDAGEAPTGFVWMLLDGDTVVDLERASDFQPRALTHAPRRRLAADDTWDTWWDTFADTFDTWDSFDSGPWDSTWDTFPAEIARTGWNTAPFFHWPTQVGTITMPMAPGSEPRGGCLVFVPAALGDLSGQTSTAHVAARRSPVGPAALDVNLVVVRGAGIPADQLQEAVDTMFEALAQGTGLTRGQVEVFDVELPGGAFVGFGDGLSTLRSTITDADPDTATNLFVIADFLGGGGTLGVSAGIPGPYALRETVASGVVVGVDGHRRYDGTINPVAMGLTMAHELGHQVGLFHTSEADGRSFDPLSDTPTCDAATYDRDGDGTVTAAECRNADGENLMFWTSGGPRLDQSGVSPEQAWVLARTAIVHP